MNMELLKDLARHQAWADVQHWNALRANNTLLEDPEIRKRLNHMTTASELLCALARGNAPSLATKDRESVQDLEAAMTLANQQLQMALESLDLDRMISLPRGPQGPFEAPAGVLLLQVLTHSQHHRGQNAGRMRALGATPPMTDFVFWFALGKPDPVVK